MATIKDRRKHDDAMTPEEREVEHARRLHEQVERVKNGDVKTRPAGERQPSDSANDSDE